MSWGRAKLEKIKAPQKYALVGGPFGSNLVTRDYVEQGVPVIRGTNLSSDFRFSLDDLVFVSEDKANELLPNNAHPGDVVFTQRGTLGQIGVIPKDCGYERFVISQSQMKLTVDENQADPFYIYYFFKSAETVQKIHNLALISGVPHINLQILREFDIPLPPLPIQRRIVDILSTYDNLIENNTRRIRVLEQMALVIYQEHFGKTDMNSKTLPKGWKLARISDIATLHRGRSYGSDNLVEEGGIPFLNLKCLARDGGFRPDGLKWYKGIFKESQTAKVGDIIMGLTDMTQERRIVARAARVPNMGIDLFVMSMDLLKIAPKSNIHNTYLYAMLRFSGFADEVKQHANGANVLHLSPDRIEQYQFPLPPELSRNKYGEIAEPLYKQCDVLEKKNACLRQTRDMLLPRLVSGEIEVSELNNSN